jgi:hypothetical protein
VDEQQLAKQRPENIEQALDDMHRTLEYYHATRDKRAIFLRVYYVMTLEVYSAIHGRGRYENVQTFLDPRWIFHLSGRFATRYFASFDPDHTSPAWTAAHEAAEDPGSSVVENAALGINAHINRDLPMAIADNLDPAELDDYRILQRRKFDHDQVNKLLIGVLNTIQDMLATDYEPGIAVADRVMGGLDERVGAFALKHFREHVWWDALAYAAAKAGPVDEEIVRAKLDDMASEYAAELKRPRWLWRLETVLNAVVRPFRRKKDWTSIVLEQRCHDHRSVADAPRAA